MRHNKTNEIIRQRCDVKNMYLIRKQIKQSLSNTNPIQCGVFFSLEISTVSYNKDKIKKKRINWIIVKNYPIAYEQGGHYTKYQSFFSQ